MHISMILTGYTSIGQKTKKKTGTHKERFYHYCPKHKDVTERLRPDTKKSHLQADRHLFLIDINTFLNL